VENSYFRKSSKRISFSPSRKSCFKNMHNYAFLGCLNRNVVKSGVLQILYVSPHYGENL
jgi:hypothetical protein